MSQDLTQDAELQAGSVEVFQSLLETLVSILSDFNSDRSRDLLDILNGLWEIYKSASNEANKQELANTLALDIPAGSCTAIYGFINKIFPGT